MSKQQTSFICSTANPFNLDKTLDLIVCSLANDKAEDVTVVNMNGKVSFTDYMIIATGRSARQVGTMAEHLLGKLKAFDVTVRLEGMRECNWVLLDASDVIVHLFKPEVRAFYSLEKMWGVQNRDGCASYLLS